MADRFQVVLDVVNTDLAKPYRPGKSDCFMMGLRVADRLTKSKLVKKYAGKYKCRKSSDQYMRDHGYESLVDLLNEHFEQKAPAALVWGDLAVVSSSEGEHVAVCTGQHFIVKGLNGREVYSLADVDAGFRI